MLIENLEDLFEHIGISYFHCEKKENFDFLENMIQEIAFGHVDHEMTEEIVVYFGGNFFVDAFIYVVVLV